MKTVKKIISIISAAALALTLSACGEKKSRFDGLIVSNTWEKVETDRIAYYTLDQLETGCELAVVGRATDNYYQIDEYDDSFEPRIRTNCITVHTIEITKVFKGDNVKVGDKIDVYQLYCVNDNRLCIDDGLTPMQEGDEWLFFLKKEDDYDLYYYCGVIDGRYPTPNTKNNQAFYLSNYPELGVFNKKDFNQKIYDEIVEKYEF